MRMRKKKNFDQRLDRVNQRLVESPEMFKGKWSEVFENNNPIYIEIGCGKGKFISEMAALYPDINFIAIDVIPDVILMGLEKTAGGSYSNLRFIIADASTLYECFDENEIERI